MHNREGRSASGNLAGVGAQAVLGCASDSHPVRARRGTHRSRRWQICVLRKRMPLQCDRGEGRILRGTRSKADVKEKMGTTVYSLSQA
jgi:hypothetical protein